MNENFSTRFGQVDIKQVKKATRETFAMDLVTLNGREVGVITKFRNTRTEKSPWVAFLGVGHGQIHLGPYWESRHAAVLAILDQHVDTRP